MILTLLAAGCGDDDGGDGGDGSDITCGPGTVLDGDQCVAAEGTAPTVTAIGPDSGLVGGGEPFTITGSGFASGGDTTVTFGDSVAAFEIVSDTEITGTTPRASAPAVTVTVTNQFGSATASFQYRGLYAADGKGSLAGNLYLVDPRDGTSVVIGPIESEAGPHAVTGLAFDAEGTLWATEATSSVDEGGVPPSQLMTIDPATGAATLVGPLLPEATGRSIADIAFAGSTLMGWTRAFDAPVSIDTATGEITVLGEGPGEPSFGNGMVETDEALLVFPAGASDGAGIRGQYYSIDPADGALTLAGTLQGTGSASVCGATRHRGTVYALLCPHLAEWSGSVLATIDPADGTVTPLAATTALNLDAVASDEPEVPDTGRLRPAPAAGAADLLPSAGACSGSLRMIDAAGGARVIAARELAATAGSVSLRTRRGQVRGLPLAGGPVEVVTCLGTSFDFAGAELADLVLVENSRGLVKLVDRTTGEALLRGVAEIRRR